MCPAEVYLLGNMPGPVPVPLKPVRSHALLKLPQSPECRLPPCQADVRRFRHPAIQIPRWTIVSTGSTVRVLIRHPVSFPVHVPCRLAADRRKHRVDQRPPIQSRVRARESRESLRVADSEAGICWPCWRHQLKSRSCRQQDNRARGMRYRRIAVYASNLRWRLPFFLFSGVDLWQLSADYGNGSCFFLMCAWGVAWGVRGADGGPSGRRGAAGRGHAGVLGGGPGA